MEVIREAKRNGVFVAGKIILMFLLLICVFNVSTFLKSSDAAVEKSFSADSEVDLYSVVDTLTGQDEFYEFRQDIANISTVAEFYNLLNADEDLKFLSMFNNPVSVADFAGGDIFDAYYREDSEPKGMYVDPIFGYEVRDVKSMQMNQNTFEFYNLKLADDSEFEWDSVAYESGSIPVMLGSDYQSIYQIGETLDAYVYSKNLDLVVAGFLEPDSSVFYQGEMNTYLDDQLIIPYPADISSITKHNQEFMGILVFQMLLGDLAVSTESSSGEVLQRLAMHSSISGFKDYSLLGVPSYLVQHQLMKQLIQDNAALLTWLGIFLSGGVLGIGYILSRRILHNRMEKYWVKWVLGESPNAILSTNRKYVVFEYLILAVMLTATVRQLPNYSSKDGVVILAIAGLILAADLLTQGRYLRQALTKSRKAE